MEKTKRKKKTGRHARVLIPVIALLFCAIVLVTALFLRSLEAPPEAGIAAEAETLSVPAPTPTPAPRYRSAAIIVGPTL